MPGVPPWLKGSFRKVVVGRGTFFLRAADTQIVDGHTLVLVTSLPLEKENLDLIASGLGTVTLVPGLMEEDEVEPSALEKGIVKQLDKDSGEKGQRPPGPPPTGFQVRPGVPPPGNGPINIQINGRNVSEMPHHPEAISGGQLPPPTHFFDVTVAFVAPLQTVIWRTGDPHEAYIHVNSRPSLLYQRLFITSLQVAGYIQDALITHRGLLCRAGVDRVHHGGAAQPDDYELDQRPLCGDAGDRRRESESPDFREEARSAGCALDARSTR